MDHWNAAASPNNAPIGIAWHHGALIYAHFFRDQRVSVGVSRSRDGDSISAVLDSLGFSEPVRGSTSLGGAKALRQLMERSKGGSPVALLVDGPRGPAERAKPGAAAISREAQTSLTPLACDAKPAIRFGSWDRTMLPLPFARVAIHFGEPLVLAEAGADEDGDGASMDRAITAAQAAARKSLGG